MANEDECLHEMFVIVRFMKRDFGVPIMQLEPVDADELTTEAIADWHYWFSGNQL